MPNKKTDEGGASVSGDLGTAELQANIDEINEKGYRGTAIDPTPNENYTVAGVTAGKPTPETDADLEAEARAASFTDGGSLRSVEEANKATLEAAADAGLDTDSREND